MSKEFGWSQNLLDALEEAISLCASRFYIRQAQKVKLESALE